MVRIIGRANGQSQPAVMLNVDTSLDMIEARQSLVKEAAAQLQPEVACAFSEHVKIFLTGGVPVNMELLEKLTLEPRMM